MDKGIREGDYVRILKTHAECAGVVKGQIGTVVKRSALGEPFPTYHVAVANNAGDSTVWVFGDESIERMFLTRVSRGCF